MPKFQVKHALGGGYGGTENQEWETVEAKDLEEASMIAYELACEDYESYDPEPHHEIAEENPEWTEEECNEEWLAHRESWIDYIAQPYNVADDPEVEND